MNSNVIFKPSLLAAAIFSAVSASASAAPVYSVTDLGSLSDADRALGAGIHAHTQAFSVNDFGEATGLDYVFGNITSHGFKSAPPAPIQTVEKFPGGAHALGSDINGSGVIVGQGFLADGQAYHAFLHDGVTLVDLGTLDTLTKTGNSQARAINETNQIAGYSTTGVAQHAVVWNSRRLIEDLGTLDTVGRTGDSQANDINDSGHAVGYSLAPGGKQVHAVLWSKSGALWNPKDLGTLGGSYSGGNAINASDQVAGFSTTAADAAQHAVLWDARVNPATLADLGTLGGSFSEAHGISSAGDVVGASLTALDAAPAAFIRHPAGAMENLNALIDPASGWNLLEARGISPNGQYIVGVGMYTQAGTHPVTNQPYPPERRAFLLKSLVTDTTPPTINYTLGPASPDGLAGWYRQPVTVTWTATDAESTVTSAACGSTVLSASTPAAGDSPSCTATSAGGSKTVSVSPALKLDLAPPALTATANITQEAASASGATVIYALPTASDPLPGSGLGANGVSCTLPSNSLFPIATTVVKCSVTDIAGHIGSSTFNVTVKDTIAPTLTTPANMTVTVATGVTSAAVSYAATGSDAVSGTFNAACSPTSGSVFPLGTTTVACTATDAAGNSSLPKSFTVTVAAPAPIVTRTDLQVLGRSSTGSPAVGTTFNYVFQVKNNGTAVGQAVTFSDVLPANLTVGPASLVTSVGSCTVAAGNTVKCNLGNLNAGQTANVTIPVRLTSGAAGARIANTGALASTNDSNAANNSSTVTVTVK